MKTRHCNLCENEEWDLINGSICNLTNEKPDFYKKCNYIVLGRN